MRLFTFLFSLTSWFAFAQDEIVIDPPLISNTNSNIIYRAFDNPFEFKDCNGCDTVKVIATGGTINRVSATKFYLRPADNARQVIVNLVCRKDGKDIVLSRNSYRVHVLPNPTVYLGGINLLTDLERKSDATIYAQQACLLYTSPSPRDRTRSRMPSSA